jgi:hypothetical protein
MGSLCPTLREFLSFTKSDSVPSLEARQVEKASVIDLFFALPYASQSRGLEGDSCKFGGQFGSKNGSTRAFQLTTRTRLP